MHRKGLRPSIEQSIYHFDPQYKPLSLWTRAKRAWRDYFGTGFTAVPS